MILHCCGCEQSSPFIDANVGTRDEKVEEKGREQGWSEWGFGETGGEPFVGGQVSAFSARK